MEGLSLMGLLRLVFVRYWYEPGQIFTLVWCPQHCNSFRLIFWIWWLRPGSYKSTWPQGSDGVNCLVWWYAFFMAKCLHCPTLDNYFSHNLGGTVWMSVCSELLWPSAIQQYGSTQNWDLVLGTMGLYVNFVSEIFMKKQIFCNILVKKKTDPYGEFC